MPNVIASATTISNGTLKRNNFLIGVNTSVQYGPTSATTFWNGVVPPTSGYTVYAQKSSQGPSIRSAANDSELITIARQYGGTNITTVSDALSYFNGQSNFLVTNIDYPNIVTSGLSFIVDAGYVPSYPRTGTTWNDLSGNGYNGTLTNGPTFSTSGSGSILCDGIDDFIVSTSFTPNVTAKSFTAWCRLTSVSQQSGGLIGLMGTSGEPFDTIVYNETGQGWGFGSTGFERTAWSGVLETSTDAWVMMAATYANNNYNLYRNGTLILNTTLYAALNYNSSSNIILGKRHGSGVTGPLGAYIANGLVYNRALSSIEVLQNYNALKSRFGL